MNVENWVEFKAKNKTFMISDHGRVFGVSGNVNVIVCGGYEQISFVNDSGKCKSISIHRLVMSIFGNYDLSNKSLVIDHIDENKLNNHISNLQAVTPSENIKKHFRFRRENNKTEYRDLRVSTVRSNPGANNFYFKNLPAAIRMKKRLRSKGLMSIILERKPGEYEYKHLVNPNEIKKK